MTALRPTYTTIEVARRLGVSLQTVQRWVDAGHLRAWKTPGGHRRIDAASAQQFFRDHEQGTGAGAGAPADAAAAPAHAPVPTPAPPAAVIVDDDPIDRELLADLLRRALPGVHVELAENGFQGLLAIGRTAPAIVVTDIHMPHMDGLEMIRQLRADAALAPRTLIAVSALGPDELRARGRLPSDVVFLAKPVDEARFLAALHGAA